MSDFADQLHEVFVGFGPVRTRKMFGGHGVYRDEVMFALVADDELFLKVDGDSEGFFLERELPPFIYEKSGKPVQMSFRLAPEEIFDDPEAANLWAGRAYAAALRNRSKNQNKARKNRERR